MKEKEQGSFDKGKDEDSGEERVKEVKDTSFEEYCKNKCKKGKRYQTNNVSGGAIYGLGFIGAAVYFISTAVGFWVGVLGFLKAIVWPAILIYEVLKTMGI